MPRLTAEQWTDVRAEREAGTSFPDLAKKYGVSHQAIQKRAKKEGWSNGEDVQEVVRRKVAEKVAGVVATESPKKRAEAIDAAADKAGKIVERHRKDWEQHHKTFGVDAIAADFLVGKCAKISAEMLAIRQKGERLAWGLDDPSVKLDHTSSDGSLRPDVIRIIGVDGKENA